MSWKSNKIIERFMDSIGMYEKVFWKILDPLVYDNRRESAKNILRNVYHFDDVDFIFPKVLDKEEIRKQTKMMFNSDISSEDLKK